MKDALPLRLRSARAPGSSPAQTVGVRSEDASLAGFTVLVTRPAGQAEGLCRLIAAAGGEPVTAPLLEIAPCAEPAGALAALHHPDGWDWLIFVSANAVRGAVALGWNGGGPARIAAIGEATAAALLKAGVRVDLEPCPPFNSEALLADPRFTLGLRSPKNAAGGQRILIVRGQGGREHLANVLQQRGATTAYAEVYRRQPATGETFAPYLTGWSERRYDAVIITSGEALSHLDDLLRAAGLDAAPKPALVVLGERLAGLARRLRWPLVSTADRADDAALIQALQRLAHAGQTGQRPLAPIEVAEPPAARAKTPGGQANQTTVGGYTFE